MLWGDGHQRRELVFVEDFVEALLELDQRACNTLVNIGAGEDYSIREFAQAICSRVGFDQALIQYDTTQYVGARCKQLAVDHLRGLIPGGRLTPLAEGLSATINWFIENRAHEIPGSNGATV